MQTEDFEDIEYAFKEVSIAMSKLEELIRKDYATPTDNLNRGLFKNKMIKLPSNYIRRLDYFRDKYKLYRFIPDPVVLKNVTYTLGYSDFLNYLINRLNTWGYIENLLIKNAIINLVSIHEALIIGVLSKLRLFCNIDKNVCKYSSNCNFYIKTQKDAKYKKSLELFNSKIGFDAQNIYEQLSEINEIRNKIHLGLSIESDLLNKSYSIENYNKALKLLIYLSNNLEGLILDFSAKREVNCRHPYNANAVRFFNGISK